MKSGIAGRLCLVGDFTSFRLGQKQLAQEQEQVFPIPSPTVTGAPVKGLLILLVLTEDKVVEPQFGL